MNPKITRWIMRFAGVCFLAAAIFDAVHWLNGTGFPQPLVLHGGLAALFIGLSFVRYETRI